MRPMLATRGDRVPGAGWVHEVKWDGMRVLVDRDATGVRIWSRNENDVTVSFPELHRVVDVADDFLLDGEVVALGDGVPSFGALADRMHVQDAARARRLAETRPVTLIVFDLLRLHGEDLCSLPLAERRRRLEELGLDDACWQVPPVYDDGNVLYAAAEQQGLEGMVSKRLSSPYRPGQRSRDWLKFPIRPTGSFVVGAFRPEKGSAEPGRGPNRLGSLLVGEPTPEGLRYRGKVGSGVAGRAGEALRALLAPLETEDPPFVTDVPRPDRVGATWVRPELVIEVQYLGITTDGKLRQPAYLGVRRDLSPEDLEGADGSA